MFFIPYSVLNSPHTVCSSRNSPHIVCYECKLSFNGHSVSERDSVRLIFVSSMNIKKEINLLFLSNV